MSGTQAVYWVGSNNHTYLKAAGVNGVQDFGIQSNPANTVNSYLSKVTMDGQATQIADPNPGSGSQTSSGGGGGSSYTSSGSSSRSSGGSTGGIYSPNYPEYVQGIKQEYGATIAGAPKMESIYDAQMNAQKQGYLSGANDAIALAKQQNVGNHAILEGQINSTDAGQRLSLQELANQIRAQYAGLGSQLGAAGAGSSSAEKMGGEGLAQEQNTERANIEQQVGSNVSNLRNQENAQDKYTTAEIQSIHDQAAHQVSILMTNYAQLSQQLNEAVSQASGEEKARLAEYGQTLTDTANKALESIENTTKARVGQLLSGGVGELKTGKAPDVTPVNPVTMEQPNANAAISSGAGNATSSGAPAGGSVYDLLQQEKNQQIA